MEIAEERPSADAPAHGCLLTNTAVEIGSGEARVAECVRQAFARLERALAARLEEAGEQGDLAPDTDNRRFACQLVALVRGLRVMIRLGVEPRVAGDAVISALAPLCEADPTRPVSRCEEECP
jgi:TetR/AcrR family transcriptional repressor of nem operon